MHRAFVISIALIAGACGDHEVEQLTAVKKQVCACKTAACAEAAMKQLPQQDVKASHRAQRIAREMLDCVAKLNDQDRPSTDPDAAPSAPGASPGASAGTP